MTDKQSSRKNYEDILGPDADASLTGLVEDLKKLYSTPVLPPQLSNFSLRTLHDSVLKPGSKLETPPHLEVEAEAQTPAQPGFRVVVFPKKPKQTFRLTGLPYKRLLWVGLQIAVIVIIGTVLLTTFNVIPNPLQLATGVTSGGCTDGHGNQLIAGNIVPNPTSALTAELNLSQTLNGLTVVVHHATADANNIAVFVTVAGPGCPNYVTHNVSLTDSQGLSYSQMNSVAGGTKYGANGGELLFDASTITGKPVSLKFHLEIASITRYKYAGGMEETV